MNILSAMKRPRGLGLAAAAILTAALWTPNASAQTWVRDVTTTTSPSALAVRDDGLIAAVHAPSNATTDVTVLNPAGDVVHKVHIAELSGEEILVSDAVFLDDGSLAVCGSSNYRAWVASLDVETGLIHWQVTLNDDPVLCTLVSMVVNDIGHIVCTGLIEQGTWKTCIFAVTSSGGTAYRRVVPTGGISSIIIDDNGDHLMTSGSLDHTITRTTNWGQHLTRKTHALPAYFLEKHSVMTSDGDVMTVGYSPVGAWVRHFGAIKTTTSGDLLWSRTYDSPDAGAGSDAKKGVHGVVATHDGGVIACVSQPTVPADTRDAALLRLDAAGNPVWLKSLGTFGVDDIGTDIANTPDGGAVVLINTPGGGFRVARVDADGEVGSCLFTQMPFADGIAFTSPTSSEGTYEYNNYGGLWGDVSAGAVLLPALAVVDVCGESCAVTGGSYGVGTAGTGAITPRLTATDGLCLGYTPELELSKVVGGAPGAVFVGFASAALPALGGTFLINPAQIFAFPIVVGGPTGAAGAGEMTFPMGTNLTPLVGVTLHMQAAFVDSNGPTNKTLTNAITVAIQ